ncbi:hypothetical protein L1987_14860 [Smallanthus sonchifolius]|uniref:Uncharacterized protein n=1 Tax=Smallanthus sonchifolius TaxID=185202 RepID=A0ACB9J608_9ASTR|nr:hypothetical protein L1987_14860 [Smallanthus sonchifolius]
MVSRCYSRCCIENRNSSAEKPSKSKWFQDATTDAAQKIENLSVARVDNVSSKSSSYCFNKEWEKSTAESQPPSSSTPGVEVPQSQPTETASSEPQSTELSPKSERVAERKT